MQTPDIVKKARSLAFAAKSLLFALFALLLITMLPAAMPDSAEGDGAPAVTLPFDDDMPEVDGIDTPELLPHITIVYPAGDEWAAEEAHQLEHRLAARFHANFMTLSDKEYLALDDETLALIGSKPSLTVSLGISELSEESYLETLSRLGREGLEIRCASSRIDITTASSLRLREGIDAFVAALGHNAELKVSEELSICDARPTPETDFKPDLISEGELDILVLSYIDSNPYTLRAIKGLVAHCLPDLVVFNGNVDGGADNRRDLALLWQEISDILAETSTPWCFTPGKLSGGLPLITVCEVISSFDGCIKPINGKNDTAFALIAANPEGIVTASVYIGDITSSSSLCEKLEADSVLYARASSYERQIAAILPAIPPQIASVTEELPEEHTARELTDLYDCLTAAGADAFICGADPVSTSLIEFEDGSLALCGSIGFDARGIGGRFDYNNSLRGGVLLRITSHRADYADAELSYIYAADLGLCER